MATATEPATLRVPNADAPFDLTSDLYSRMVEAGLIPRDRRVYLRGGKLYEKIAKTKAHGSIGAAITWAITRRLPNTWSLWPESTIVLDAINAPLPDFAVIRSGELMGRANPERDPGPNDVALIIEIAVISLRDDLTTALELYARAGIPAYWVVDVPSRRILAHGEPRIVEGRGEYARVETYRSGDTLPLLLDGVEAICVPFDELLR